MPRAAAGIQARGGQHGVGVLGADLAQATLPVTTAIFSHDIDMTKSARQLQRREVDDDGDHSMGRALVHEAEAREEGDVLSGEEGDATTLPSCDITQHDAIRESCTATAPVPSYMPSQNVSCAVKPMHGPAAPAVTTVRTRAPIPTGSTTTTAQHTSQSSSSTLDPSAPGFHGYSCHRCGGGVGWNAKRCRKCRTPVRKPNQRRGEEPPDPLLPSPLLSSPLGPLGGAGPKVKGQRGRRPRHMREEKETAISPAVSAMVGILMADPIFQSLQKTAVDARPSVPELDDAGVVAPKMASVKVLSSNGGITHVAMQREGYSYTHSVSRSNMLPPAPIFAPLSALDSFQAEQIEHHCKALQAETFQRRFRPLIIRLIEHSANGGVFNSPVQPHELGISDYFTVIKHPMDLGTIRQRLESGSYPTGQAGVDQLATDVTLVFKNATTYNPPVHPIHIAAQKLLDEFQVEFKKLTAKSEVDVKRKDAHACGFCQGQMCRLCQDKCLRFDPPLFSCDCCMERIKRGDNYYRAPSGQRWCVRCVSNGGANAEPGAVLPPISILHLFKAKDEPTPEHPSTGVRMVETVLRAAGIDMASVVNAAQAVGLVLPGYEPPKLESDLEKAGKPKVILRIKRAQSTNDTLVQPTPPAISPQAPKSVSLAPSAAPSQSSPATPSPSPAAPMMRPSAAVVSSPPSATGASMAGLTAFPPGTKFLAVPTASLAQNPAAMTLLAQLQQQQQQQHHQRSSSAPAVQTAHPCVPSGGAPPLVTSPISSIRPTAIISNPTDAFNAQLLQPKLLAPKPKIVESPSEVVTNPYAAAASAATSIANMISGPSGAVICEQFHKAGIDPKLLLSYVQTVAAKAGVTLPSPQAQPPAPRMRRAQSADVPSSKSPVQVLAAMLRARLEKRRNDDVVAEPWVQCDRCAGWVHQVCAMFNARKNALLPFNAPYVCPLCRKEDLESKQAEELKIRGRKAAGLPSMSPSKALTVTPAVVPARETVSGGSPTNKVAPEIENPGKPVLSAASDPFATASSLPHTPLSAELETRVRDRMSLIAGHEIANSITVRMVSSLRKTISVPDHVRSVFTAQPPAPDRLFEAVGSGDALSSASMESVACHSAKSELDAGDEPATGGEYAERYASQYPYRQRVILLFQKLDGVDVCLFALYVQEYGPDCPAPNTNKVYIAYLDSVRYLRPLISRTAVYHELLAAYMTNARHRGYEKAYIWACPPQRGDGYIFHVHPPSQRVPGKERLREWYDECLRQLTEEGVVSGVTSLFDEYFEMNHSGKACTAEAKVADDAVRGTLTGSLAHLSGAASPSPVHCTPSAPGHPPGGGAIIPSPSLMGLAQASNQADLSGVKRKLTEISQTTPSRESKATKKARTPDVKQESSAVTSQAAEAAAADAKRASKQKRKPSTSRRPLVGAAAATSAAAAANTSSALRPQTASKQPTSTSGDTVKFRGDSGLPPYFAGDFWAMEMERMVRDIHKRLNARASGISTSKNGKPRTAAAGDVEQTSNAGDEEAPTPASAGSASVLRTIISGVTAVFGSPSPPSSPPASSRSLRSTPRAKNELDAGQAGTDAPDQGGSFIRRSLAALGFVGTNASAPSSPPHAPMPSVHIVGPEVAPLTVPGRSAYPCPSARIQLAEQVFAALPPTLAAFLRSSSIAYSPTGLSIKVGSELSVPSHPAAALAMRLRDMRREFIVVHLAPLRHSDRARHRALQVRRTTAASDSTMSDAEDFDHSDDLERLTRIPEHDVLDSELAPRTRSKRTHGRGAKHAEVEPRAKRARRHEGDAGSAAGSEGHGSDTNTESSTANAIAAAHATEVADAEADEQISCDFFDTRHGFIRMCQGNNYQFDTLRRAKHSSMMILWHLHNPSIPAYAHTCNMCESDIGCGVRWHCETCFDFDICESCYSTHTHPHTLTPLKDNSVVVTTPSPSPTGTDVTTSAPSAAGANNTQPSCMVAAPPQALAPRRLLAL